MEFIYQANDRFFLEALNTLVQRMQTEDDYVVADPRTCIVNAAELGGEARVRLTLPARRKEFGGKHPVVLARLPAEKHHWQAAAAVMADWVVSPTKRSPQRTYDREVHFFKSAEVKQRMGESRSTQPLHLGIISPGGSSGGLGRRILSPFHAPITMRAAFLPTADQPLGPTEAFVNPTTGDVVLPEVPEIARSRGFPAQIAQSGRARWLWDLAESFFGRTIGAEHAVLMVVIEARLLVPASAQSPQRARSALAQKATGGKKQQKRVRFSTSTEEKGYESAGSGGSDASAGDSVALGEGCEHVARLELSMTEIKKLRCNSARVVTEG